MIVIDLGCCEWPAQVSIEPLVERFHPHKLFGFDPYPEVREIERFINGTTIKIERKAAWLYDGFVGLELLDTRSRVCEECGPAAVPCFDLSEFILRDLSDSRVILKMDIEGSEYQLLPYLHETGVDSMLELLLIEWHGEPLDIPFRCKVEEWV